MLQPRQHLLIINITNNYPLLQIFSFHIQSISFDFYHLIPFCSWYGRTICAPTHIHFHFLRFPSISFDFLLFPLHTTPTTHQLQYISLTPISIQSITHNWITQHREVNSNLMSPAMMNHDTDCARICLRIIRHRYHQWLRLQYFPSSSTHHPFHSIIIYTTHHTLIMFMMHDWKYNLHRSISRIM